MKLPKIPTIVAVLILVIGLATGIVLVQSRQLLKIGASPDIAPQDVRITNITDTSFTVSWITDKATAASVNWGETSSLGKTATDESLQVKNIHFINIRGLSSQTTYYFKIVSNNTTYDNDGIAWQVKTGPTLGQTTTTKIVSGSVLTATGEAAQGAIVYLNAGSVELLATKTGSDGSWVISLASARASGLASYAQIGDETQMDILVQAGPKGVATAKIKVGTANPTSPIILGQTHDFRGAEITKDSSNPEASIDLPDTAEPESGFAVGGKTSTPSSETVTLESVEEGESITTTDPEFFGEGPPGTKIEITIESDPVTGQVTIGQSGNWKWSPPADLEEGTHTITLKWRDTSGILRTLTRTFVVQAAEGPAFVSTPSASPSPSPTASPSATATPTATPRVSVPSTETGVPDAGVGSVTIAWFFLGLGLIAFGAFLTQKVFD